ncbi:unnamed protein product [Urochloa decumbens]|uniref:Uncharacterized protein n=1 Tax=Urochloa decumbens TaxID=240449 RepID=A0ABC8W1V1_9POAL
MAQRCGPPFDFDLNEPPPEDDDIANEASPARAPEPIREPSPRVLLPPSPENSLSSPHRDSMLPPPPPSPSPRDPLPAPVPESSRHDPLAAPVPESSPFDPRPSPTHEPSHLPSPVLDLEAPLSSLDDDYDEEEYDYDEADLPPPPPLPPSGLVPVAAAPPARSSSSVDTPPSRPGRRGTSREPPFPGDTAAARLSSPENNSAPRGRSSGTESSHRSRRRPYSSYDPRDDDAISKQRRVGSYDDGDDAGSSRSGSRRSDLASPLPHHEQGGGGWHAPVGHGEPGAPPRNRQRRRPRRTQRQLQQGYEYTGSIPKQQQGRGWEQPQAGLREGGCQERPQAHQVHGPRGPEEPKVGYSSYGRTGSYENGRPEQEQHRFSGNGKYHHHQSREAPPPSSGPRGREDPYYGRRSQSQGPPNPKVGGYQHSRERPGFRPPSSGAHGRDGSSGGRPRPPQQPINDPGAYQQRKSAPRGGERFPDRAYHPYARDGGAFDGANGGNQGRREPPPNYEHRRRDNKQQSTAGGPARGRQYY